MVTTINPEVLEQAQKHVGRYATIRDTWPWPIKVMVKINGITFTETNMDRLTKRVFDHINGRNIANSQI